MVTGLVKAYTKLPKSLREPRQFITCSIRREGKCSFSTQCENNDFVAIIEAPKDEDIMAILLRLGNIGNIRTRIMRAWKEAEAAKIVTALHPSLSSSHSKQID